MKPEIHLDSFLKTPYGVFYSILLAGTLVYMTNKHFLKRILYNKLLFMSN